MNTLKFHFFHTFLVASSLLINLVSIHAFPGAAGHCDSGDLSGKFSGHGENGGGPLSQGSLRVRLDSTSLQTFTTAQFNANQVYTVTLDFTTSSSNFFFRGLLFRLSGKNGENVEGTLSKGSDNNVQVKAGCAAGISAMTHNSRVDKTSVTFEFEYTGSTDADLLLEVTVVRERAADNWFYSAFNLQIGDGGSPSVTDAPTSSPTKSPTVSPTATLTSGTGPTNPPTKAPTASPTDPGTISESCAESPLRFRTRNPTTNKAITRDCTWVANKSTNIRCRWENVRSMCPNTCGSCLEYSCSDGTGRFKVIYDGRKITRDCGWVAAKSTRLRCAAVGVEQTCRETCDACN